MDKQIIYFQRHPNAPQHRLIIDKAIREAVRRLTGETSLRPKTEKALSLMGYKFVDVQSLIPQA